MSKRSTSNTSTAQLAEVVQDGGLAVTSERAREYRAASKAAATIRAYRADWLAFSVWCQRRGRDFLPATPDTVALYLTDCADSVRPATLQRRLSSISQAHQAAGIDDPPTRSAVVRATMQGIRRSKGTAPMQKAALLVADLRRMLDALPDDLSGTRDRALLLVGYAGGFRRSELVALDVADIDDTDDGLVVLLRRSKTDQESRGRKIGIPFGSRPSTCPVRSYRAWLAASGIESGPVFRRVRRGGKLGDDRLNDQAVAWAVKRAARRVGLDADKFAGHSLRAGLCTSAAAAGASERAIANQTGHRSMIVLRGYIRAGTLFDDNAAAVLGL